MTYFMTDNFEDRYEDKIGITTTTEKNWNNFWGDTVISSAEGTDTISINGAEDFVYAAEQVPYNFNIYGAYGQDTISFDTGVPDLPDAPDNTNGFWKYHEDVILKEIREYLGGTYNAHYASQESKTQTLDLIEGIGDAEPFCRSNAIKYLSRFGKKNGKSKQDILKAIHYCILLYHFAGLCNENTEPYETF